MQKISNKIKLGINTFIILINILKKTIITKSNKVKYINEALSKYLKDINDVSIIFINRNLSFYHFTYFL